MRRVGPIPFRCRGRCSTLPDKYDVRTTNRFRNGIWHNPPLIMGVYERWESMKAAIVTAAGKAPVYGEFRDPVAQADEELISVTASALSHLTKARAAGSHYSSAGNY